MAPPLRGKQLLPLVVGLAVLVLQLAQHFFKGRGGHGHGGHGGHGRRPEGGHGSSFMDCGANVPLCGVLALESGLGPGKYHHSEPVVHGLWPATGSRGSSKCITPADGSAPRTVHSCYQQPDVANAKELLSFEVHEWSEHGRCAGVADEADYFEQVCSLAARPLRLMAQVRAAQGDLRAMEEVLLKSGLPVHHVHQETAELQLSACADALGEWRLSPVEKFATACGSSLAGR